MRKIIASVEMALNGVTSIGDWSFPHESQDRVDYSRDLLFSSDAILMGRATYEVFSTYWPEREKSGEAPGEEGFAERINTIAKYVVSSRLTDLAWNNSHLIQGKLAEEVAKLKQQPGMNIVMYGAGEVAHTLIQHGLLDEIHLIMYPAIASVTEASQRLLNDAEDIPNLQLIETNALASGIVILKYGFGTND